MTLRRVALAALALLLLPLLVVWWTRSPLATVMLIGLVASLAWWWRGRGLPRHWHPCGNPTCRAPIPARSRARFCSSYCRRLGRLDDLASVGDSISAERAQRIRRVAELQPGDLPSSF